MLGCFSWQGSILEEAQTDISDINKSAAEVDAKKSSDIYQEKDPTFKMSFRCKVRSDLQPLSPKSAKPNIASENDMQRKCSRSIRVCVFKKVHVC